MVPDHTRVVVDGTVVVSGQDPVSKRNKAVAECRDCRGRVPGQVSVCECDVLEPDTSLEKCEKEEEKIPSQARVVISARGKAIIGDGPAVVMNTIENVVNVICRVLVTERDTVESDTRMAECRDIVSGHTMVIIDGKCDTAVPGQVFFTDCNTAEGDTRMAEGGEMLPGHARFVIADECDTAEPDTRLVECRECGDMVQGHMTEFGADMSDRASANVGKMSQLGPSVTKCKERVASPARDNGLEGADSNKKMTECGERVAGRGQATDVRITSLMRRLADPFLVNKTTLAAAEASFRRGKRKILYALFLYKY